MDASLRAAVESVIADRTGRSAVIRSAQASDELGGAELRVVDCFRLREAVRNYPVDATAIVAAIEVEVVLDRWGQRPRVLDHLAVHVGDVECAVRSADELHWAEPVVGAGEELELALAWGATRPVSC